MLHVPAWLHALSIASLTLGALAALLIAADLLRHKQRMGIMNVVWPVTALFGSLWVVWQYFTYGRNGRGKPPFPVQVANGALHCGSGCTLGDIVAEWIAFGFPAIAVAFGYHRWFGEKIFAVWLLDFVLAYLFGIVFQYFTIAPMRGLPLGRGIVAAIKADTASLTAWQLGMYGFMAFAYFYVFRDRLGSALPTDSVEFWFMMQIAMICGFITAYPVNGWLIRAGLKEAM